MPIQWCPTNKVFNSCKCEGTCADPNCTTTCSTPTCVCPDGFLMEGDDCIPKEDCGCYLQEADGGQGRVIAVSIYNVQNVHVIYNKFLMR